MLCFIPLDFSLQDPTLCALCRQLPSDSLWKGTTLLLQHQLNYPDWLRWFTVDQCNDTHTLLSAFIDQEELIKGANGEGIRPLKLWTHIDFEYISCENPN